MTYRRSNMTFYYCRKFEEKSTSKVCNAVNMMHIGMNCIIHHPCITFSIHTILCMHSLKATISDNLVEDLEYNYAYKKRTNRNTLNLIVIFVCKNKKRSKHIKFSLFSPQILMLGSWCRHNSDNVPSSCTPQLW